MKAAPADSIYSQGSELCVTAVCQEQVPGNL